MRASDRPRSGKVAFVQADLTRSSLRPGTFDVVFSGGVLHHNADTREALEALAPLVAQGGQIYVWLYGKTLSLAPRIRAAIRRVVVPLPSSVQRMIFRAWTA
jgi:SAM-dependent methyltransferase